MQRLTEIKDLLRKVLGNNSVTRTEDVRALQDKLLEEQDAGSEEQEDFLSDLLYNLNFYDPMETDASLGYYGDKRLTEFVSNAIEKIQTFIK
jgi:hypothetical protein